MPDYDAIDEPKPRDRLPTRIVTMVLIALLIVLTMTGWTLWLSWQLEGAAAAIADTGALNARANLIGTRLQQPSAVSQHEILALLEQQDAALERLRTGVPSRPLLLPQDSAIQAQFARVAALWRQQRDRLERIALALTPWQPSGPALPLFSDETARLVEMIEQDSAARISLLRLSQYVLIAIAAVGTLAMIYLLYLWIILPISRLRDGLTRMATHEFAIRLPVETRDEVGMLAAGFNRMAAELERLYRGLEACVAQKTEQLATRNQELETLYELTAFLNQPNDIDSLCEGFLRRSCAHFHAEGGVIRTLDAKGEKLLLLAAAEAFAETHARPGDSAAQRCVCRMATRQDSVTITQLPGLPQPGVYRCEHDNVDVAVAHIVSNNAILGTLVLRFGCDNPATGDRIHLLQALGRHLGVALENRRFAAKAQQLAVAQERNLVAQGLHDSLAQGLNFLNIQVQLLDDAVKCRRYDDADALVPLLKTGVEESYQDIRELLMNFRAKLAQGELLSGIEETVARFERQTQLRVEADLLDDGPPLPPEQQLQVLFILQEALSNIRKHADAGQVTLTLRNQRDFLMVIRDDGRGYDPQTVALSSQLHLGLKIMQERAEHIGAHLAVTAQAGDGVTIRLHLAREHRQAA